MKRLIFIFILFSNSIFACQRCNEQLQYLIETIDELLPFIEADKTLTIEQKKAFKMGIECALKLSSKILISNHREIKMTLKQWENLDIPVNNIDKS